MMGNLAPDTEFLSRSAAADFEALPARYGWPTQNERGYRIKEQLCGKERPLRVIALGAGCAGICLAKFLPEQLRNVTLTIYDKNPEYGGTWYENRLVSSPYLLHLAKGGRSTSPPAASKSQERTDC